MPKEYNLVDIFNCLSEPLEANNPHYFLFLLGTNTHFTPLPTVGLRNYERGETLSYAALAVAQILKEPTESNAAETLSFSSPSVNVLNGPDTLGTLVGERIAQALYLSLSAVARGKETLQITAHSRGAVQSILLMHELTRIRKALTDNEDMSLYTILEASPCRYTKLAIKKFFKFSDNCKDTKENRKELLKRLSKLKINPFLIDPVPGDPYGWYLPTGWHDERFFLEPEWNTHELLICRDERSHCFIPIIPKGMNPRIIPGHHGTLSGNRYDQQLALIPKEYEDCDTTSVQDLVLYKLFNFYHAATATTGMFAPQPTNIELKAPLDGVVSGFLSANELQRDEKILQQYEVVLKHNKGYLRFALGGYPWLGLSVAPGNQRFIYYGAPTVSSISVLSHEIQSTGFVNAEHAMMLLRRIIYEEHPEKVNPADLAFKIIQAIQNPHQTTLDKLTSPVARRTYIDILSKGVDLLSQKYLNNHLAPDEKKSLLAAIEGLFNFLAEEKAVGVHLELIKECRVHLRQGMKKTIETSFNIIVEQQQLLIKQLNLFLYPEKFIPPFEALVSDLESASNAELTQLAQVLKEISPGNVVAIRNALDAARNGLESEENKKTLTSLVEKNRLLTAYFEAFQKNIDGYLTNIEELNNRFIDLQHNYSRLEKLIEPEKFDLNLHSLVINDNYLINLGGKLLKVKPESAYIITKPVFLGGAFYQILRNQAIAGGAPSPEMQVLEREVTKVRAQFNAAAKEAQELYRANSQQVQQLNKLSSQLRELQSNAHHEREVSKGEVDRLKLQITALTATNAHQVHLLDQFNSEKERKCLNLIHDLLLPLTRKHQELLQKENEIPQEEYETIQTSFKDLEQILINPEVKLPSLRLTKFQNALKKDEAILNSYAGCRNYLEKAMLILTVFTGVGALLLGSYYLWSSQLPSFFRPNVGEKFFLKCHGAIESQDVSEIPFL